MALRGIITTFGAVFMCACSSVVTIPSSNQNSRVDYVVMHATSENFAESVRLLTTASDYPVSSHYLIPLEDDPTYKRSRLRLHQFVHEHERAWHAGVSFWAGETGLNDRSIGIEIVNEFTCSTDEAVQTYDEVGALTCTFVPFARAQIDMLIKLLHDIQGRYPELDPVDIVAHSDIAIRRKSDPGSLFPWRQLYEAGIGAWFDEERSAALTREFSVAMPSVDEVQFALAAYGYEVAATGVLDTQTRFALRALQMHFRPADISGDLDAQSAAILWSLVQRYRPLQYRKLVASQP